MPPWLFAVTVVIACSQRIPSLSRRVHSNLVPCCLLLTPSPPLSVFGLVSAAPRFRRVAFVTAFVVCGLVTLLFGGGFYYFWYGWGHQVVDFQLSLALTTVGILALAAAVSPDAWLGGDKAEQRRRVGLGFCSFVAESDLYLHS